jgi:FixJ family two-component response regulator
MTKGPGEADSLVVVVDDDASVRQALTSLLQLPQRTPQWRERKKANRALGA